MAKTAKIALGGVDYTIHAFNIGELERVAEIMEGPVGKASFGILKLALKRAEPSVADVDGIEATTDEIKAAIDAIMSLAGLKQEAANPPAPPLGT